MENTMKKLYRLLGILLFILWVYGIDNLISQGSDKAPSCILVEKNGKIFSTLPFQDGLNKKARNEITLYTLQYAPSLVVSELEILFFNKEAHHQGDFICFYKDKNYVYGLISDILVPLFSWFDSKSLQILTGCGHYRDGKEFVATCAFGGCFQDKNTIFYPGDEVWTYLQATGRQFTWLVVFDKCEEKQ